MEFKKEPGKDVYRQSRLFISLGFLLSLSLVLTAFEWKFYTDPVVDLRGGDTRSDVEIIKIPVTDLTPPKPAQRPVVLVEKKKDEPESLNIPLIDLGVEVPIEGSSLAPIEPEAVPDPPFILVEENASPYGGMETFYSFVANKLRGKYPAVALRAEIEGRVFVEFVVERNGKLNEVRVVKGIGGGCDELAAKVVESAPPWQPGKQRGKPVRQRLTIAIVFKLG